jgi:hypothetical protein
LLHHLAVNPILAGQLQGIGDRRKVQKMKQVFTMLFARWKVIAHKIGEFQSRLLLSFFYFVFFAPFAVGLKMFSDPLQIKSFHGWSTRRDVEENSVESARRQY